jgi:hypothetical protein
VQDSLRLTLRAKLAQKQFSRRRCAVADLA